MVLDTYINSDGSDLNRWVALACLVFNLVAIGGLVIFYRSTRKGWYFIYIARLHRKLWYTDIAASFHPEPIEQLAMAVNQALELARVGEAQSEADTLYYEEQSIRLEDNSIIINGQMQSTENVKYASMDVVTGTPWYMLALSYAWIFLVASVYGTLSRSFSSTGALVLIIGVAVVVFLSMVVAGKVVQITNKDKRYSTSGAYECKLHTADQTMLAFISVDKEFVRATVDAVNAVVRSHAADSKRPSASRPSHRTT
jgi:low affinity Fe/Cu permease